MTQAHRSSQSPAGPRRPADDPRSRLWSAAPHVSGLALAVAASVLVGRPEGWIGVLIPLGPIAVRGLAGMRGRDRGSGWREAFAFDLVAGALIAGGWALLRSPEVWPDFALLFPLGTLLLLFGVVNFVGVSISRTVRAWRGQRLDYPWIPIRLRDVLGLDDGGVADGDR